MEQAILSLENVHKGFGEGDVLRGIDLSVPRGEFLTLLGPSGCGKTTTLRIIAGLEAPDKGRVLLGGVDVTNLPPEKRNVNTVFQNYALFPHMNVFRNIAYGLRLRGVKRPEIRTRVEEMLRLVQLEGYGKRSPAQLSGGQRQRVAIARAVVLHPHILLLDEPLGALDLQLRRQMQGELKALQESLGITFIYITHDQEEALNMSDRIAVMRDGRFEQIGSPQDIYEHPQTRFAAGFIGQTNLLEAVVSDVKSDGQLVLRYGTNYLPAYQSPQALPAKNEKVALCLRMERVRYDVEGHGAFTIPAKLIEHRYAGGVLRSLLELPGGQRITAYGQGMRADGPTMGDTVFVWWDPQQAAVVSEEEDVS